MARSGAARAETFAVLIVAAGLMTLPLAINPFYVAQVQTLALYLMVAAGLAVAVSFTGLISVGHASLMAAGSYAAAYGSVSLGLPFPLCLLGGMAAAAAVGFLLAIPTARLGHFYFAMVTLGLGLVTEQLLVEWSWTGGYSGIFGVAQPDLFGVELSPAAFFDVTIALTAITLLALLNVTRCRFGRSFLLVRDDEVAASSVGIRRYSTKLLAFTLSAIPAGLAGALLSYQNSGTTPGSFTLNLGLFFLLAVVVGGRNSILGPIGGVVVLFALPLYLRDYRAYTNVIFGVILLAVLAVEPGGFSVGLRKLQALWRARRTGGTFQAGGELEFHTDRGLPEFVRPAVGQDLVIASLDKHFGGVRALSDVNVTLRSGHVSAIIGANGSGKTTLLNIVSGFYKRDGGTVRLGGRDLPRTAAGIARCGLGRTFQTPKVVADQTVLDNVMVGFAPLGDATLLEAALALPRARRDERGAYFRALALLDYVGLHGREMDRAGDLPHAHLRFLEIARALISNPQLLLMDEPAAGLSGEEVDHLDRIVRDLAARGLGIAIVEHNIGLIMGIADHVVVLDTGVLVAEGDPSAVQQMPEIARIYLGDEWLDSQQQRAVSAA